jgi:sugar-phosphatase
VGTRPQETFEVVAPHLPPSRCLRILDEIEDEDVRVGDYHAFEGARELFRRLPSGATALVTSNYERRVLARFARVGLAAPAVVVDADAVTRGKPDPEGYLTAARRLGVEPVDCLVVEDGATGMQAGRAANMTVWSVNVGAALAVESGAQRTFPSLAAAAGEIVAWQAAGG